MAHAHAHDEHGHEDHGHDEHGHDEHEHGHAHDAHDEHGDDEHGHEDHGHAHEQPKEHHGHSHAGGHGHAHGATADADRGKLAIALGLIVCFMCAEFVVGIIAHSLALLTDSGHMLTDAAALAFSIVAIRLAQRPAAGVMTYGLKRVEILSAQANGMTLLILGLFVIYEAIVRLFDPPSVEGGLMFVVALVGIAVNIAAVYTLAKANRQSLAVEGSFQHILTDLFAFIGTAIAAAIVLITGFDRADPIASLVVALLMLRSAYGLLRDSGRVFLEMAPRGMDPEAIGKAMASYDGVVEVHDLHIWEVTSGFPSLSAHVVVEPKADCHAIRFGMDSMLADKYGLEHATLQVEHVEEADALLQIEMPEQRGR